MGKKILVIGSLNMDMVTQLKDMPREGETVLGDEMQYIPGGKGANQACAAGSLGGDVTMLGCVGADEFGQLQKEALGLKGVKTQYLKVTKDSKTGTAIIYLNHKGNNCIVVIQGANLHCTREYLEEQDGRIAECDYLLIQMEIPYETIYYAVNRAHQLGKTILLNPAPAPEAIPDDILSKIDYLTPNETELMKLTGIIGTDKGNLEVAADVLLQKGVKNVIVTLGERGALLVNKKICNLYPTRKVTPVDTTAAGDCFNGAFAVALAEGRSAEEAIGFSNMASSIAVTRQGAQSSIPTREEVNEGTMD